MRPLYREEYLTRAEWNFLHYRLMSLIVKGYLWDLRNNRMVIKESLFLLPAIYDEPKLLNQNS